MEKFGVALGIIGAFLVANELMLIGYPCFMGSSILLTYTAFKQHNKNLITLNAVYGLANANGLLHFFGVI
jgi:hypothetical protein